MANKLKYYSFNLSIPHELILYQVLDFSIWQPPLSCGRQRYCRHLVWLNSFLDKFSKEWFSRFRGTGVFKHGCWRGVYTGKHEVHIGAVDGYLKKIHEFLFKLRHRVIWSLFCQSVFTSLSEAGNADWKGLAPLIFFFDFQELKSPIPDALKIFFCAGMFWEHTYSTKIACSLHRHLIKIDWLSCCQY